MEYKICSSEVKEYDDSDLTVVHFISTERRDRGNDVLHSDGMKIFGLPVVLFMHGFSALGQEPIARPIWIKKGVFKGHNGIQAKTEFYNDETGRRLWKKTTQGFLPNWSVGWRPLEQPEIKIEDGQEVRHVHSWELLEYSLVSIPMQSDAQTTADKGGEALCFKIMGSQKDSIAKGVLPISSVNRGGKIFLRIDDSDVKLWADKISERMVKASINKLRGKVE